MTDYTFSEYIRALRKDISEYTDMRIRELKLALYEKVAMLAGKAAGFIILLLLGFFAMLFLSVTTALWIGQTLHSNTLGFGVIAIVYLLLFVLMIFLRGPIIEAKVSDKVADILMQEDDENI